MSAGHDPTPWAVTRRAMLAAAAGAALFRPSSAEANELVERVDSKYNTILVYRRGPYVTMTFGYNRRLYVESIANTTDDLELPVSYTRYMTLPLAYAEKVESILEIGFGGGRTAWYLHRHLPDVRVTSVELDGKVVELAKKYFKVFPDRNFTIAVKDGRLFLFRTEEMYDIVLIDAYRGPFVPFHLMTKEFYTLVRSRLRPGGVIAQNVEPSTMLFDASVATLKSVFAHVDFYGAEGNIVTIAYDGPLRDEASLRARAKKLQRANGFRYSLSKMLDKRRLLGETPKHKALTDDFAPVESLRAIEKHNTKWIDP